MASPARTSTFTGANGTVWTTANTAVLQTQAGAAAAWTVNTWNGTFAASPTPDIQSSQGRITVTAPASGTLPIRRALADPGTFGYNVLRVQVAFFLQTFNANDAVGVILRQITNATTNSYLFVEFGGTKVGKTGTANAARIGNYWAGARTENTGDVAFDLTPPAASVRNNYDILSYDLPVGSDGSYVTVVQVKYWQGTGAADIDCPAVAWSQTAGVSGYASVQGTTTTAATLMIDYGTGLFGNQTGRAGLYVQPGAADSRVVDIRFDDFTARADNMLMLPRSRSSPRGATTATRNTRLDDLNTRPLRSRTTMSGRATYALNHPTTVAARSELLAASTTAIDHPMTAWASSGTAASAVQSLKHPLTVVGSTEIIGTNIATQSVTQSASAISTSSTVGTSSVEHGLSATSTFDAVATGAAPAIEEIITANLVTLLRGDSTAIDTTFVSASTALVDITSAVGVPPNRYANGSTYFTSRADVDITLDKYRAGQQVLETSDAQSGSISQTVLGDRATEAIEARNGLAVTASPGSAAFDSATATSGSVVAQVLVAGSIASEANASTPGSISWVAIGESISETAIGRVGAVHSRITGQTAAETSDPMLGTSNAAFTVAATGFSTETAVARSGSVFEGIGSVLGSQADEASTARSATLLVNSRGSRATSSTTARSGSVTTALTVIGFAATAANTARAGIQRVHVSGAIVESTHSPSSGTVSTGRIVVGNRTTSLAVARTGLRLVILAGTRSTVVGDARSGESRSRIIGARAAEGVLARSGLRYVIKFGNRVNSTNSARNGLPAIAQIFVGSRVSEQDAVIAGFVVNVIDLTNRFLALLTEAPDPSLGIAGMAEIVPSGTAGYARQRVAWSERVGDGQEATIVAEARFGPFSSATGPITHCALVSTPTGTAGLVLYFWELPNGRTFLRGESPVVPTGGLIAGVTQNAGFGELDASEEWTVGTLSF